MSQAESFCAAVEGVVCEGCPILRIAEEEFADAVLPGITATEFSDALGDALGGALIEPERRSDAEADLYDSADDAGEYVDVSSVVASSVETALGALEEMGVIQVDEGSGEESPLARELAACVLRDREGECTFFAEPAGPLPERTPEPGEQTYTEADLRRMVIIARLGTPEEVLAFIEESAAAGRHIGDPSRRATADAYRQQILEFAASVLMGQRGEYSHLADAPQDEQE